MLKKIKKTLISKIKKTKAKKQTSSKKIANVLIDRHQMIQEAAYFRAEKRYFFWGNPVEDWLAAEAEIDTQQNISKSASG